MESLRNKMFEEKWNFKNRDAIINKLQKEPYDIIIIGGGITGAGVAREAALRGLKAALIDKQDFATGTSSRSTKMAHGGLRYLESYEFGLVRESTTERNWLLAHLPHLIRPLRILMTIWQDRKDSLSKANLAVRVYDLLSDSYSKFKTYKKHEILKPEEIIELEPFMKKEGLLGGSTYYDTNVDDARLVLESIKESIVNGADAINYVEFKSFIKEDGKIIGIKCLDLEKNIEFEIKGKQVVNATGIWTDQILEKYPEDIPEPVIRPTKGVHLVFPREKIKNNNALIMRSVDDNRGMFLIPRGNFTLIGTTDTDYKDDLDNPYCTKEDADYIIRAVKYLFPDADLKYDNIISTFAGIRPLVMQKGKSESELSRDHLIFWSDDGLLTITGGKLTTYRKMAEDLFKKLIKQKTFKGIKRKKNFSRQKFIIGLEKSEWQEFIETNNPKLDQDILDYLYQQYGHGAIKIVEICQKDPVLKERLLPDHPFITGEIVYSLKNEQVPHLIDVFCRRTEMAILIHHTKQKIVAEKVAKIMAKEYGWNEEKKSEEIKIHLDHIKKTIFF